ncbi:MAG: type II toxin-antitoxin system VapB family antitoxin [Methylococcaceae bacterium]
MINIAIDDENKITVAQQLGHHKNLQETVEKALEFYVQYLQQQEFKIDKVLCLNTLEKIKQGDFSGFTEIEDIDFHIESLKNETH